MNTVIDEFYGVFCESDKHLLPDCGDFQVKQLNEKRDYLMKRGGCFICF